MRGVGGIDAPQGLLVGAAAWALHGAAQAQGGRRGIAVRNGASPDDNMRHSLSDLLRRGPAELAWVDGRAARQLEVSVLARVRVSADAVIE